MSVSRMSRQIGRAHSIHVSLSTSFLIGDGVLSRLAEQQHVVRERWPRACAVALQRLEHERVRLRADRLRLRILVDGHLAVVDPAGVLVRVDDLPTEVRQSDDPVGRLRRR